MRVNSYTEIENSILFSHVNVGRSCRIRKAIIDRNVHIPEGTFIGANARAKRVDDRRAKENPTEAVRRPATRLATAILMHSFGGLRREGVKEGETLPPGITEAELLSVCVGPDLDSTTALACLKELKEQCLYLHFDGARYCFKKDPNVTLLIEQEAEMLGRHDKQVHNRIEEMIEARLGGHPNAIVWPAGPADISDRDPTFLFAYLPPEFVGQSRSQQDSLAKELLEKYGDKQRIYRNGLGLVIPAADQVEILRRSVRYLIAAQGVRDKAKKLNLTDEQKGQVRERESTEQAAAESALLKLYTEVWFPRAEEGGLGLEKVAAGGRPLQTTLNDKKQAMIHERIMELVTTVQPRVFGTLAPTKIVDLFRLGEGPPPTLGVTTREVVDGFYSFLGFTRLMSSAVVRKSIARGINEGHFGYVSGPKPTLSPEGKYEVTPSKVRYKLVVAEDEIDLDSGSLLLPQAIPTPAPSPVSGPTIVGLAGGPEVPNGGTPGGLTPTPGVVPPGPTPTPGKPAIETTVELTFAAGRDALFTAWNAMANLADMAGKVTVTVRAESPQGFDKSKLQNGVYEPLREADLIES